MQRGRVLAFAAPSRAQTWIQETMARVYQDTPTRTYRSDAAQQLLEIDDRASLLRKERTVAQQPRDRVWRQRRLEKRCDYVGFRWIASTFRFGLG